MLTKKGKQKKLAKLEDKRLKRQARKERLPPKQPRNRGGSSTQARNQYRIVDASLWGRYPYQFSSNLGTLRASGQPIKAIKPNVKFKIDWRKEGF